MPHVTNPGLGGGQLPVLFKRTSVSSAQLQNLLGAPVLLVGAPGAGKLLVFFGALMAYKFGTVAYDAPGDVLEVIYGSNINPQLTPNASVTGLIASAASAAAFASASYASIFGILPGSDNTALNLYGQDYNVGPIATTSLGAGGLGYAVNDTGVLTDGDGTAAYKVLTVGAGGAVLTYQITNTGHLYPVENGAATATGGAQPGVGTGLTINILTIVQGDGTLTVTTYYQVVAVP